MSPSRTRHVTTLRVRCDDCDGSRAITTGHVFSLADEARFDLYDVLAERGVVIPARHVAKAERLEMVRYPGTREQLTVETWIEAVGRTSYRVAHRFVDLRGEPLGVVVSTLVAMPVGETPATLHPSLRAEAHEPLALPPDEPGELDGSVAFLRTLDAWPSHENAGRHLARTRMIDWLDDLRRIGVARAAFELAHPRDAGPVRSLAIVYERESRAGDGLRLAMAPSAPGVFEASIVCARESVARARLRV